MEDGEGVIDKAPPNGGVLLCLGHMNEKRPSQPSVESDPEPTILRDMNTGEQVPPSEDRVESYEVIAARRRRRAEERKTERADEKTVADIHGAIDDSEQGGLHDVPYAENPLAEHLNWEARKAIGDEETAVLARSEGGRPMGALNKAAQAIKNWWKRRS